MGGGNKEPRLRVDARKFAENRAGGNAECTRELVQLLSCLQGEAFDEDAGRCADEYAALAECSKMARAAAAARKGHVPSINHHLSRIARLMRR